MVYQKQAFQLDLNFGDYQVDFSRDGRFLALAGSKGHVAVLEWKHKKLLCEFNTYEKNRAVKFLESERLYAVAQKSYMHIYDSNGLEIHRLKSHPEPKFIEYLPYHFLMASISRKGVMNFQDISVGNIAATYKTKIREPDAFALNPWNALIGVGDSRGVVQMYIPSSATPVVKVLAQNGPITSLSFSRDGNYFVTSGTEGKMKIWDSRVLKSLDEYWVPSVAKNVRISQTGLLAVSYGWNVIVWKDWHLQKQKLPYMKHMIPNDKVIKSMQFVPYEDVIGTGLSNGFSSFIVPGSGDPNFDTYEDNVFGIKKQVKESSVHKLMDKLPPDTITFDPNIIGTAVRLSADVKEKERKQEEEEEIAKKLKSIKKKNKMRGRSKHGDNVKRRETLRDEVQRQRIQSDWELKVKVKNNEKTKIQNELEMINDNLETIDKSMNKMLKKIKT